MAPQLAQRTVRRPQGAALPWYTYAWTTFLEGRLTGPMRVFEYGAGLSSLWYSQRVHEVVSVEHDPDWAALIRSQARANCRVVLAPTHQQHLDAFAGFAPFDIVVVDGEYRPECAFAALDGLKPDGVMISDNSTWPDFADTYRLLQARGFRRIGFAGLGPVSRHGWETSVVYRDENCLGI